MAIITFWKISRKKNRLLTTNEDALKKTAEKNDRKLPKTIAF